MTSPMRRAALLMLAAACTSQPPALRTVHPADFNKLCAWFDARWAEAEPFAEDLAQPRVAGIAGERMQPPDIFWEAFNEIGELVDDNRHGEKQKHGVGKDEAGIAGLRWLEAERLGVLFEPGSVEALAEVLEQLAGDSSRLAELRRNARNAATSRYNAETQRDALREAWGVRVGSTRA